MRQFILAAALLAAAGNGATAATVTIPGDHVFPESMTATADGTLYIGSIGEGAIFRAAPGAATAELFVKPNPDLRSVNGVLADEGSNTLYVCTNDWSMFGVVTPGGKGPSTVKTLDLKTGAAKGSYVFPGNKGFCNDIAVGKGGTAYFTDSIVPRVLRLKPGASVLDVWVQNDIFGIKNFNLDGIAFGTDGAIYVTGLSQNKLFRIAVNADGSAGAITQLSGPAIKLPDGFRPWAGGSGNQFLLAEGGHMTLITVEGDKYDAKVLVADADGSVSAAQVGKTAWVLLGQLKYLFNPKLKGQKPAPFTAQSITLP